MKEIWKEIPNTNGAYEASSLGRIRSYYKRVGRKGIIGTTQIIDKSIIPRLLKSRPVTAGYLGVGIKMSGIIKYYSVHRLMALTFLGKPEDQMDASHKDGNKLNNYIENIIWLSHRENCRQRTQHGTQTIGEKHPNAKLNWDKVIEIRSLSEKGLKVKSLSKMFKISESHIYDILREKQWKKAS